MKKNKQKRQYLTNVCFTLKSYLSELWWQKEKNGSLSLMMEEERG